MCVLSSLWFPLDLITFKSPGFRYIEELLALHHVVFYLQDAVMSLLLWRGSLPIPTPFHDEPFLFPIHSLTAFLTMILLVEHPHWVPSFFFACIAWIMLASQGYRHSLPDVWSRCKSFNSFVVALAMGESPDPPESIEAYANYDEAQAFLDKWQKRIEDSEAAAKKSYEEQIRVQEEYEREMEELGDTKDTDIASKSGGGGVSIDPFKSLLFPVQQNLALVCRYGMYPLLDSCGACVFFHCAFGFSQCLAPCFV